jgi:hypothetical protein
MMPLLKRASRGNHGGRDTSGGGSRGKKKPVKLSEAIMSSGANTNQITHATILNITWIIVENKTTTRVNYLTTRRWLHGKSRNMSNIRNSINCKTIETRINRSNNGKSTRIISHMRRRPTIKNPWACTWMSKRWYLNNGKVSRRTCTVCW